jgi:hypothetical protein
MVRTHWIAGAVAVASFTASSLVVPRPNPGAVQQIKELARARHLRDAFLIAPPVVEVAPSAGSSGAPPLPSGVVPGVAEPSPQPPESGGPAVSG